MQQPSDEQIATVMNEARLEQGVASPDFFGPDLLIFKQKVMSNPSGRTVLEGATVTIITLGATVGVTPELLTQTFLAVYFLGYKLGLAAAESEALHKMLNVKDPNADAGRS